MKKRFLVVLLAAIAALCMAFGPTGCGESGKDEQGGSQKPDGGGEQNPDEGELPTLPQEGYSDDGLYFKLNPDGKSYWVSKGAWSGTNLVIPGLFNGAPVTLIEVGAFEGCTGLTSIEIPDSVTEIGEYAFRGCTGLTEIEIPDSVTEIEYAAFQGCTGLKNVTIGNGVTSIGVHAFEGCTSLTRVDINDLVSWCNIEFAYSTANPLSHAHHLYLDGEEVTDLRIPAGVTSIGVHAFEGCTGLTEIVIPDSVTSIGDSAFSGCTGLTEIEIPDSVTSIGSSAFYDCTNLTSIRFHGTIEQWKKIEKELYWNNGFSITEVVCDNGTLTGDDMYRNL